jgi:hypothetical protein
MVWLAIGVAVIVVVGAVAAWVQRPSGDLGSVSTAWITEHRDTL